MPAQTHRHRRRSQPDTTCACQFIHRAFNSVEAAFGALQVVFEGLDPDSKAWTMSAARRIGGHVHNPAPDQIALRILLDHSLLEVRPTAPALLAGVTRAAPRQRNLFLSLATRSE